MVRADKAAAVAELTQAFRDASAAVLTEYRGLTVAELKELRRTISTDAQYAVVKNTLTKIAARDSGYDMLAPMLEGPSAIAFVTGDAVSVAKTLREFVRTHPMLVIKGGVLEGRQVGADDIRRLADLQSREEIYASFAGAIVAALSRAAATLQAPLTQAARLADALREKVAAEGAGALDDAEPAAPTGLTETTGTGAEPAATPE